MSENNVIISIQSRQSTEGAPPESIELVTEGVLRQEENAYFLSYQESEVTGMAGTLTTFHLEPKCITLLRVGEFSSQMVFQEGRRHVSLYTTPYGELSMGIHTRRIRWSLSETGGEIDIGYNVEIDHQLSGIHDFHILVREKRPTHVFQTSQKENRRTALC